MDRLGTLRSRNDAGRAVRSDARTALLSLTSAQAGALQSKGARPTGVRAVARCATAGSTRGLGDGARTGCDAEWGVGLWVRL
jgi:hypothetical protein